MPYGYALAINGVDTVILGVKNRQELLGCLAGEAKPRLSESEMVVLGEAIKLLSS